jgi:hypothetical protein
MVVAGHLSAPRAAGADQMRGAAWMYRTIGCPSSPVKVSCLVNPARSATRRDALLSSATCANRDRIVAWQSQRPACVAVPSVLAAGPVRDVRRAMDWMRSSQPPTRPLVPASRDGERADGSSRPPLRCPVASGAHHPCGTGGCTRPACVSGRHRAWIRRRPGWSRVARGGLPR